MVEILQTPDKDPLDIVAIKIAEHAKKSDQHVVAAAMLMRDARRRVDVGEAGDVTWYEWALKNITLSGSRLRELQRIAEADDPEKEIERQRRLNRKRVKKCRQTKAAEQEAMAEERKQLIAWAKAAPISNIRHMLDMIPRKSCSEQPCALSPVEVRHV